MRKKQQDQGMFQCPGNTMSPPLSSGPAQRILVTGATGVAGPALVYFLLQQGHAIRIMSRHGAACNSWHHGVETCKGDIRDPRAVNRALRGIDSVFHLAAMLHDTGKKAHFRTYQEINVDATRYLVMAARHCGVKRFVYFSTINVYGPSGEDECFDEASLPRPRDAYALSKQEAEKRVLETGASASGDFSVTVLRPAAVYGRYMKGNYNLLISYLKKGGCLLLGKGTNKRTLVFDTDLARAACLVLDNPEARDKIYNVTDGRVHTLNDIVNAICTALGKRAPGIKLPAAIASPFIRLDHRGRVPQKLMRFTAAAAKQLESIAVSSNRIQEELGFTPHIQLNDGWHKIISSIAP